MNTTTRQSILAAAAGALAVLLLLPLLHPAPAAPECAQRSDSSCNTEDRLRGDERYAAPDQGVIVQVTLPPRPMPPKHPGGGGALLEDSGDRTQAYRRFPRTVDLIAPDVPRGNPHADAWSSRAPPIRAA